MAKARANKIALVKSRSLKELHKILHVAIISLASQATMQINLTAAVPQTAKDLAIQR
ncbi:rare lipoprotein A [Actinobacillus equuli]|nr:rare lipoprotein A [Actinobacillus equuli]